VHALVFSSPPLLLLLLLLPHIREALPWLNSRIEPAVPPLRSSTYESADLFVTLLLLSLLFTGP
jgi:hypothetical protein